MKKSSIRELKEEQKKIRGYTISKEIYNDIFVNKNEELYRAINSDYKLFLFGNYGDVSTEEMYASRRARRSKHGQIKALYRYNLRDILFVFDYRRHKNGLIRVMYLSEAKACEDTFMEI